MQARQRITVFPIGIALLLSFSYGPRRAAAQGVPSPALSGFLRSLNSRDFFRQGRLKLEQEIEQMDEFSQLSSELLQVDPEAPVQEDEIRELEPQGQGKQRRDR